MKKKNKRILVWAVVIIVLAIVVNFIIQSSGKPGEYDEFASCLTQNDVAMFGTDWCQYCQNQKSRFGNSFNKVDYVNCDTNSQECFANGIQSYPTWKINGEYYNGVQPLNRLSDLSGCPLE